MLRPFKQEEDITMISIKLQNTPLSNSTEIKKNKKMAHRQFWYKDPFIQNRQFHVSFVLNVCFSSKLKLPVERGTCTSTRGFGEKHILLRKGMDFTSDPN